MLLCCRPAAAGSIAVMDARSLQASRHQAQRMQRLLQQALEESTGERVLDTEALALRAREHHVTRALLDTAEAAFDQGRRRHVDLDLPGAITAYRDAITSYRRAGAAVYLPAPLAETHLQLAAALSESNRLADALEQLRRVTVLTPWRRLDPSIYNPSVRKLFDRKRGAVEKLPDMPAEETALEALGRMSGAAWLVRPLIEASGGGLVVRAVLIDLATGEMAGVESVLIGNEPRQAKDGVDALVRKLLPSMGVTPTPSGPAPGKQPPVHTAPALPADKTPGPEVELAAGFSAGFGAYSRLGARALRLRVDVPLHRRIRLSFGTGTRIVLAGRAEIDENVPGISGELTFWQFPVEACVQFVLLPGNLQIHAEMGAVFGLVSLTADKARLDGNATNLRFLEDHAFGYGPGGLAAAGLRWRLGDSLSLSFTAGYHIGRVFYSDELLVPGPAGGNPVRLHPRDVLQGVDLTAGIVFDL